MAIDYDSMASAYACNRKASRGVVDELQAHGGVEPEHKVLEVGCGTASHVISLINVTGCRGWGVEPSGGMCRHAPVHNRLVLLDGTAGSLLFDADFFDLVFSVSVIHHVTDLGAHFREAKRTLRFGGMICTVTDSTEMIRNRRPLSVYWPSSAQADIKRYPTVDSLLDHMSRVGFTDLETGEIRAPFAVMYSTPYQEKAYSCLHLISEEELGVGLRRLESDLQKGPVEGLSESVCIWGRVS
ncbi:MAG: class I SAM-dependent methyltransferase [Planctomycetota bacterium]